LDQYGILIIANSVVGIIGGFNFGLTESTVKLVSKYRGDEDLLNITKTIQTTYSIFIIISILMAVGVYVISPYVCNNFFKLTKEDTKQAITALQIAGVGLGIRTISSVFSSALRGYERYDIVGKINSISAVITISISVILAILGSNIQNILIANVIILTVVALLQIYIIKKIVKDISFIPSIDKGIVNESLSFGMYTWIQGFASLIYGQADKIIIGSLLGMTAATYYTVSLQVAQQAHGIIGSSLAFLFPMISKERQREKTDYIYKIYKLSLIISVLVSTIIMISLTSLLDELDYPTNIDFISIDTENTELDVLKGIDFSKYNIKMLVIENNFNEPFCKDYLEQFGYKLIHRIAVNDFFVKD
jgi:O-antigen/teichoic acid export membrane protein